jgi:uncharacterized RDD family membrane protein YckC
MQAGHPGGYAARPRNTQTPPVTDITLPAPLWRRLFAAVYDGLLLFGLIMVTLLADVLGRGLLDLPRNMAVLQATCFLVGLGFFGWFWTHGGQTLGMRAWRLRVRRLDGRALRWPVAAIRYAVMLTLWLALLIAPLLLYVPRFHDAHPHAELVSVLVLALLACCLAFFFLDARRRFPQDWISGSETVVEPKN